MKAEDSLRNNHILVVDDNPSIHEDIRKILCARGEGSSAMADAKSLLFGDTEDEESQIEFEIDSAFQGEEGLNKVRQAFEAGRPYALAFVDVRMPPGWDGVETITRMWKDFPDLQVVICTAYSDYSWEEMIHKIGRSDSMVILKKPFDNIEVLQLAHALTEKWVLNHQVKCRLNDLDKLVTQRTTELQSANDQLKKEIAERMQMEKALRVSEERFSKAFRASPIPLAIQSLKQEQFVDVNEGFVKLTGIARDELLGRNPEELHIWDDAGSGTTIIQMLHSQMSIRNLHIKLRTPTGQVKDTLVSAELFELDEEPLILTIVQDITEQIKLENQLRQAQKMEAVGQLAAGVAHDFNNILTVVQGHASLLLKGKPSETSEFKQLKTISAAAERAAKLVRQLLTFSRKQFLQIQRLDISETIQAVSEMFPRVLGEHIVVDVNVAPQLPPINADAGMVEQMLMNLAVNARDAMEEGGTLTVRAEAVEIGPEALQANTEARSGSYVRISVSDTGCGIGSEVLPRVFEPFFTTKPVGKGTGLGLATVYGIVKQHEGWIEVQSEIGSGTTFKIFIPADTKNVQEGPRAPESDSVQGGPETILVVEDEEPVRDLVFAVLSTHGYKVLTAASGDAALQTWDKHKKEIHLLMTDMVMPGGMMGRELAEKLLAEADSLKVIYTSGYSPGMAGKDMALLEGRNFLAKPYQPNKLLKMVRDCLDHLEQSPAEDAVAV